MNDTTPAQPAAVSRPARQKVPAFARYKGTSAWRKNPRRVKAYAAFLAAAAKSAAAAPQA